MLTPNRSHFLKRMSVVALTAGAAGFIIYGILVLWYLWPDEAPDIIAHYLFAVFLLAFVAIMPCLGIIRIAVGRRKWRRSLIAVSLFGLASTMAARDVSHGYRIINLGRHHTELMLTSGWVYFNKYGPAPPSRWPGGMLEMNPILWSVRMPLYVPLVLFSVIPGVEIRHWIRRRRRRRRGFCEDCGYDLRGAMRTCSECGTHVGRCPECGIVVVRAGEFHAVAPC